MHLSTQYIKLINFNFWVGVRNTSIPHDIKNQIEDILHKTSKNLKRDKVFNALKLLENYLPDIMKAVHEKLKVPQEFEWTENESRKLEAAMEFYTHAEFYRDPEERWRRVHGFVNTKSVQECKEEVEFQEVTTKNNIYRLLDYLRLKGRKGLAHYGRKLLSNPLLKIERLHLIKKMTMSNMAMMIKLLEVHLKSKLPKMQ